MLRLFIVSILAVSGLMMASCSGDEPVRSREEVESERYDLSLEGKLVDFEALPDEIDNPSNPLSFEKVALGHKLYFDKQLSKKGNISCNSCHNLATFGVDNLPTSPGDDGINGGRNSPTVLNAALHKMQFWDGRAKDVEEQAGMPILNPVEMAIPDKQFLVERLSNMEEYRRQFSKAFPGKENPLTYQNIQNAIAAFERKLLTPSRFDAYLKGDKKAITAREKYGLATFINVGCVNCHSGVLLGGTQLQKFGVFKNYWEATGSKKIDNGKADISGKEGEKYMFKVPSLRNIDKTAPYFHDGSVGDLEKAVVIMADIQLNYKLSKDESTALVAFLKSLNGKVPEEYRQAPVANKNL